MSSGDLLSQLDKLPAVRQFDAFPKTQALYTQRSARGGALTVALTFLLFIVAWSDIRSYLYGEHGYSFATDPHVGQEMQINLDLTVAMKCHYLTVDVRDAVGDRLHVSDSDFTKDGTTFEIGHAGRLDAVPTQDLQVGKTIDDSRKGRPLFSRKGKSKRHNAGFSKTDHIVKDGPACRIYGSMIAKKVTGNLHITTLGHGYFSWEHTDHSLMNLSHVVHEFSFGPYFPEIAQPLDHSVEIAKEHFTVFQYFVTVVPTNYIDSRGRRLETNQYSVTDYTRSVEHGQGIPGIFIKYDMEPLTMTIRERTTSLPQFLVRLAGILGGVWVCTGMAFRVTSRVGSMVHDVMLARENETPESYAAQRGYDAHSRAKSGAAYSSGASSRFDGNGYVATARDKANEAWNRGFGNSHRKTESVQQKIFSEEGRAPW